MSTKINPVEGYKRLFVAFFIIVICLLAGAILSYLFGGGFSGGWSNDHKAWAEFGSYFGGVVGSLMAVASVVLIAWTVALQGIQLEELQHKQYQHSQMEHVSVLSNRLERVIEKQWDFGSKQWSLGEEMAGAFAAEKAPSKAIRRVSMSRLAELLPYYAEAIRVYASNYHMIGVIRFHRQRLDEVYSWLSRNFDDLGAREDIAMNFTKLHIDEMKI